MSFKSIEAYPVYIRDEALAKSKVNSGPFFETQLRLDPAHKARDPDNMVWCEHKRK